MIEAYTIPPLMKRKVIATCKIWRPPVLDSRNIWTIVYFLQPQIFTGHCGFKGVLKVTLRYGVLILLQSEDKSRRIFAVDTSAVRQSGTALFKICFNWMRTGFLPGKEGYILFNSWWVGLGFWGEPFEFARSKEPLYFSSLSLSNYGWQFRYCLVSEVTNGPKSLTSFSRKISKRRLFLLWFSAPTGLDIWKERWSPLLHLVVLCQVPHVCLYYITPKPLLWKTLMRHIKYWEKSHSVESLCGHLEMRRRKGLQKY